MKVSKEILEFWKENVDHGDKGKIQLKSGLSYPTITEAIENGEASEETIIKINDFFKDKKKRVDEATQN